jgi:hypothetical protein
MSNRFAEIDAYWETPFAVCPDDEPRQLREIVRYATLAPNAHNTQPWAFAIGPASIRVFADYSRRSPHGDPGDRELWLSLGCALENLCLAARRVGYAPAVHYFPADEPEECLRVRFTRTEPDASDPLFSMIPARHMNRRAYDRRPIPAADLAALEQAVNEAGVRTRILTHPADFERVVEVVTAGFAWQSKNQAFLRELRSWIRFSPAAMLEKRDGLCTRAIGKPQLPEPLGQFMLKVMNVLGVEAREIAGRIRSSSALLVLFTDENDKTTWARAGRCLARIKLTATQRGIRCAHLNNNWQWDVIKGPAQRALALGSAHPQVTIRLGYAETLPHAPRRPLDAVLR